MSNVTPSKQNFLSNASNQTESRDRGIEVEEKPEERGSEEAGAAVQAGVCPKTMSLLSPSMSTCLVPNLQAGSGYACMHTGVIAVRYRCVAGVCR